METYVITGSLAAEFKKFLDQRANYIKVKKFKELPGEPKVSMEMLKQLVTERYVPQGHSIEEACNERELVRARGIAMYLARAVLKLSYPQIAQHFGGKHHTTVIYGIRQIKEEINVNPMFSIEMSDLEQELKA